MPLISSLGVMNAINFGLASSVVKADSTVIFAHASNPYLSAYSWSSGYGAKYANPSAFAPSQGNKVKFSPNKNTVVMVNAGLPGTNAYKWSKGFTAKIADPASYPSAAMNDLVFDYNSSQVLFAVNDATIKIAAYPWSDSTGYGSRYTVSNQPAGNQALSIDYISSGYGTFVAIATDVSPYITIFPWGTTTGTKVADPSTLPTGTGNCVRFSPDKNYVSIAHTGSPFISIYPWLTSFGTKVANPAVLPGSQGKSIAFTPDSSKILIGTGGGSLLSAYNWSNGFGSKLADPVTPVGVSPESIKFNALANVVFMALGDYPYQNAYAWSSSGFGSRFADPATLPPNWTFGTDTNF